MRVAGSTSVISTFVWNYELSLMKAYLKITIIFCVRQPVISIIRFAICLKRYLVYVWVLVLEVVVGVLVNDETDRVWSEALFALTCS